MSLPILHSPSVPESLPKWLELLGKPTLLWLPGPAELPARALSVLLHGNEPSGIVALHRYLVEGRVPARRTLCFIGAVGAALREPPVRFEPGRGDLNRAFLAPSDDPNGALAKALLEHLRVADPEALIDLHNNSGHNPAYGVVVDARHISLALVELFTQRAVLNTLNLGTLVEAQVKHCPSVVIECGQAGAPGANEIAFRGLCRYLESETLPHRPAKAVHVYRNSVRFELRPGVRPTFVSDGQRGDATLALRSDLEAFNFQPVPRGEVLGWCKDDSLPLIARDASGIDRASQYLEVDSGVIRSTREFTPIMMSTRPEVVVDDCLCYLVEEHPTDLI